MSKRRDYYQVLQVDRKATETQIKKAYKRMAVKWHPDKNPENRDEAVEKFREISEAYQNLSDPEKRKIYDNCGFEGPKASSFHHFKASDAQDLFSKFFQNHQFDEDPFFREFLNSMQNNGSSFGNFSSFGSGKNGFNNGNFGNGGFKGGFGSNNNFSNGADIGQGVSKSVSTTSKTVNGKTIVTKKTTLTKEDGSKEVTEESNQNGKKLEKKYLIGPGDFADKSKWTYKY